MIPELIQAWGAPSPHGEVTIIDPVEEYRCAAARMKERSKGECGTSFSYAPANPMINVTPDPIAIDSMDGVDVIEPEKNQ